MPVERLWTDRELTGLNMTIRQLRRTRFTATSTGLSIGDRLAQALLKREKTPQQIQADREVVLFDARALASSAGEFIAAKVSKTSEGYLEFEEWQDTLSESERKYKGRQSTYARTTPIDVGGYVIDAVRALSIDSYYTLKWLLIEDNNLGSKSVDELLSKRIGVIAPLSGDYLLANVCRSLIARTKEQTFPLKLAAVDSELTTVYLEPGQQGEDFRNLPEIGIFLDVVVTGNTGNTLYGTAREAFPGKIIHHPKVRQKEFKQSTKIRRFWNRAARNP